MYGATRLALNSGIRLFRYPSPYFHSSVSPPTQIRPISHSSSRLASETPIPTPDSELYARLNSTTLAHKLKKSPEALQAIKNFIEMLQKEGLDVSSGKPPSTMQMLKLGMKKEVRDGMLKLTEAMQKAGVDPTDKNMLAEVMAAMKKDQF